MALGCIPIILTVFQYRKLFLTHAKSLFLVNTYQALKVLNVSKDSSQSEIKSAYRRLALEHHPDKNGDNNKGEEFKRITEAYNHLKNNPGQPRQEGRTDTAKETPRRPQWGAPGEEVPEQDWSKFTRQFEEGDPDFWKEYERRFWEDYNARAGTDRRSGGHQKPEEPKRQPDLNVMVDKSLCIGCCSCEIIAPDVFQINKESMSNPKSTVIDKKGAGINKIMNAARTCPTKAIMVDDLDAGERLFPY